MANRRPHNNEERRPLDRPHGTLQGKVVLGHPPILDMDAAWREINRQIRAQLSALQKGRMLTGGFK